MHYFVDRLQAGPLARTYMLGYEQMMRKKSNKSRKYRGHSPSKRQNILIFHQNPLQHPISSLSASHVITCIYCEMLVGEGEGEHLLETKWYYILKMLKVALID